MTANISQRNDLRTVCLGLGPYRNLTTLTAGMLFLHPAIQVLNHGAPRILPNPDLNFLQNYSDQKFSRFVDFAIELSGGGERGLSGGSITLSHAYDGGLVSKAYEKRFGKARSKEPVHCLFWKEPLRVANFIRMNEIDLAPIFQQNPMLRFLMPIRDPIDCAFSNLRKPHKQLFIGLKEYSVEAILDAILAEIAWFRELADQAPDRFFYFFEYEVDRDTLVRISEFLGVVADERWISDCLSCYQIRGGYDRPKSLVSYYQRSIESHLANYPDMQKMLKRFG